MTEFSPGEVFAEKFRIIRPLGEGGIGQVFEVEHLFTRHKRALKVLHPELRHDQETVKRFLREAMAAGVIKSEHIVESLDAGVSNGVPFLLMELLDGKSLRELLRWKARLTIDDALVLALELTKVLATAHAVGVVHRDLKPENVFVLDGHDELFIKVLDFGLSRFSPLLGVSSLTAPGARMGTPLYMAPEQMMGEDSSSPSLDMYAVGVILYEAIGGSAPFAGPGWNELVVQKRNEAFPKLRQLREDCPEWLELLTNRLLSARVDTRPDAAFTASIIKTHVERDRRSQWWKHDESDVTVPAGNALSTASASFESAPTPVERGLLQRLKPFQHLSGIENVLWLLVFAAVLAGGWFLLTLE